MRRTERRFREELGLIKPALTTSALTALALRAGFDRAAFVDPSLLPPLAVQWQTRRLGSVPAPPLEESWLLSADDWSGHSSILVCCLSCRRDEPDDLSTPGDPHARIAPFARAHYYRTAVEMLRTLAARAGPVGRPARIFANSRVPEKPLLVASGLGAIGKNGLCIVPGLGSLFVIAGIILPIPTASVLLTRAGPARDPCGACERCLRACPVGALVAPGVLDPGLCLQAHATSTEVFDDATLAAWGTRLYGCQDCQDCCPHNSGPASRSAPAALASPAKGELGPSVSVRLLLSMNAAERKALFHGTAMGMSWVPDAALVRNALLAAGAKGDPAVTAEVRRYADAPEPAVRAAALWALERLAGGRPTAVRE